jgi:hypothetical protein
LTGKESDPAAHRIACRVLAVFDAQMDVQWRKMACFGAIKSVKL